MSCWYRRRAIPSLISCGHSRCAPGALSADLRSRVADRFSRDGRRDYAANPRNHRCEPEQSDRALCEAGRIDDAERNLRRARPGVDCGRSVSGFCARNERSATRSFEGSAAQEWERKETGFALRECRRADVYDERVIENFRIAADEGGVAGDERAGTAEETGTGTD